MKKLSRKVMPLSELIKRVSRWWSKPNANSDRSTKFFALSNLGDTARNRHIQSLHESGGFRNPDILAGALMSEADRQQCLALDAEALLRLRKNPYYYYLTARTKFYDQLILDAVVAGIRKILIVGAGFDTRFYRYGGFLAGHGVALAEADQPAAVEMKSRLASMLPHSERISYLKVDLNQQESWTDMLNWLSAEKPAPLLVLAEGVSPYVESASYLSFLAALASALPADSWLAYDFKWRGVKDDFGVNAEVRAPFRMPTDAAAINDLHTKPGYRSMDVMASHALMETFVPGWNAEISPLFQEDAVIKLVR